MDHGDRHRRSSDRNTGRKRERSRDKRDSPPRGRKRVREEGSRTPSRTPEYSPIYKDRKSLWDVMIATEHVVQPTSNPLNPQQLSQRRLYVGNLPDDVNEQQLLEYFNTTMLRAGVVKTPGQPVVSVTIYREKAYAFIELRSAEEASTGMSFDGITLHGKPLRVRRPKDYQPPPDILESQHSTLSTNNIVSTNVADSQHKIFIGGLPPHLKENDVKKLLTTFGQLRSFNLVRDAATGLSKGFAFCEYLDPEVTDDACKALNGMSIGDKNLIVQRASVNPKHQTTVTTVNVNQAASNMLNLSMPAAQLLASAAKNITPEPTKVLVLMNIINTVDFPGDRFEEEFDELIDDIIEECSRYGNIKTLLVPRNPKSENPQEQEKVKEPIDETVEKYPFNDDEDEDADVDKNLQDFLKETEGDFMYDDIDEKKKEDEEEEEKKEEKINVPGFGKVYIEYENVDDAKIAQRALSGRRYDGRMVITSFLTDEKWNKRVLEPRSLHNEEMQANYLKNQELQQLEEEAKRINMNVY